MKELQEKKRQLNADEMGLGKSGSAIFAKEYLQVKQAVIVAPSNVIPTWEGYLSNDPTRGGCFKEAKANRVLTVTNPAQLAAAAAAADYDYVLISQERLNEHNPYAAGLKQLDAGMLIVDESHLLRNLKGVRSGQLLDVAESFRDLEKYTMLLSGTPAPQHVSDLAVPLKLLHPDKFGEVGDRELMSRIVRGHMIDLRSLLVPYMQMKKMEDSIDMPPLTEEVVRYPLSPEEALIYEVLLEEDELTPLAKIALLRKFLLSPELLEPVPDVQCTKIGELETFLQAAFEQHDKVVVFVNGFIEDVIRGEAAIMHKLHLPAAVQVTAIHGQDTQRAETQREFQTGTGKKLLLVSGDTAAVGINLSAGEDVYFYNEPWSEYDRQQQRGRIYRPGLQAPLTCRTLIMENTIEEGIHAHIQAKYRIIEKILRGIPIGEREQLLLEKKDDEPVDITVDPELASYYFSAWDRLLQLFRKVKEIGVEKFATFLEDFGEAYAGCYTELGARSYQANANRLSAALIDELVRGAHQTPGELKILDAASGPEMLKQHIPEEYQAQVVSLDMNKDHFPTVDDTRVVGSFTEMPFAENTFDYVNLSLAWHYSKFVVTERQFDRLESLLEINRTLKLGGKVIINNIYGIALRNDAQFGQAVQLLGFRIVDEYTGPAAAGGRFKTNVITLEKISHMNRPLQDVVNELKEKNLIDGLKFRQTEESVKDTRRVIAECYLNGRLVIMPLNERDRAIVDEETQVLRIGEQLRDTYDGISKIPRVEVIHHGFGRVPIENKYVLFKKLNSGSGAIVIKDAA